MTRRRGAALGVMLAASGAACGAPLGFTVVRGGRLPIAFSMPVLATREEEPPGVRWCDAGERAVEVGTGAGRLRVEVDPAGSRLRLAAGGQDVAVDPPLARDLEIDMPVRPRTGYPRLAVRPGTLRVAWPSACPGDGEWLVAWAESVATAPSPGSPARHEEIVVLRLARSGRSWTPVVAARLWAAGHEARLSHVRLGLLPGDRLALQWVDRLDGAPTRRHLVSRPLGEVAADGLEFPER